MSQERFPHPRITVFFQHFINHPEEAQKIQKIIEDALITPTGEMSVSGWGTSVNFVHVETPPASERTQPEVDASLSENPAPVNFMDALRDAGLTAGERGIVLKVCESLLQALRYKGVTTNGEIVTPYDEYLK